MSMQADNEARYQRNMIAAIVKMERVLGRWVAGEDVPQGELIHDSSLNTFHMAAKGQMPGLGDALIRQVRTTLPVYEAVSNMSMGQRVKYFKENKT